MWFGIFNVRISIRCRRYDNKLLIDIIIGENGIMNYMKKDTIVVDHTTSSPDLAKKIY